MEFVKLIKTRNRMCAKYGGCCEGCPLSVNSRKSGAGCNFFLLDKPAEAEKIITDWAAAHPLKTRLQDFLEKYPKAKMNSDWEPESCCEKLGYVQSCPDYTCEDCWNKPIDDK